MSTDTIIHENERYFVTVIDDALSENGRETCPGYGIFNKETNIREATGLVLGEVRWRADQFNNMIVELDERDNEDPLAEAAESADDDVVLN